MLLWVATVDDWIPQSSVGAVVLELGSNTPLDPLRTALLHLLETLQVLFDGSIATFARLARHSLLCHYRLLGIVRERISLLDHSHGVVVELFEIVARIRRLVRTNAHQGQILHDGVLKLLSFFRRICVIESAYHLPLVPLMSEVVVQQCGFRVSDMEVSAGNGEHADKNGEKILTMVQVETL